MELTYSKIKLSNPKQPELQAIELKSLVDTGALMLCIPQAVAYQLNLEELDKRPVTIADGSSHQVPYTKYEYKIVQKNGIIFSFDEEEKLSIAICYGSFL